MTKTYIVLLCAKTYTFHTYLLILFSQEYKGVGTISIPVLID